ncbi:MAG TPA: hypothetical protein DDZ78_14715, partial [Porphyromonadaceae bacterium]|nr:hypothetical protein [Porphyromonadaceae bacterium]
MVTRAFCESPSEYRYDYIFFDNSPMKDDYFYAKADYTSPSWLKNARRRLPVVDRAFSPGNALELTYVSSDEGDWYSE